MSKIVRFRTKQDTVVGTLEELLEKARSGDIAAFVFAAKCPEGEIATSWANADMGLRQELISHQQVDLNYAIVEANVDKLIEWV